VVGRRRRALRGLGLGLALGLGLGLAGCDYVTSSFVTNDFSGDAYPVEVDVTTGAIVIGIDDGAATRTAVLDVLSPFTVFDDGPDTVPAISTADLTVLGARGPGGSLDLPRARLVDQQILALHPCSTDTCVVGPATAPRAFDALIGMDAFSSDALRLDLAPGATGTDELFILPDIAGGETARTRSCDAVMPAPFRGGGTLLVGGTEVSFPNRRIALDVCLAPDPDEQLAQSARGADALFVLSTGIGISILDETAYARYAQVNPAAPALAGLPVATVDLPLGPTTGHVTTIEPRAAGLPALALVAKSASFPRAACRQVYANHLLVARDCTPTEQDCPCSDDDLSCSAPAIVELSPTGGIPVLVVSDEDANLQALRTELRPDQPEVDGILGTSALRTLELDIDFAHDRLLGRCSDPSCTTRPELSDGVYRPTVQHCLASPVGPIY
jgi:hypothetical protein